MTATRTYAGQVPLSEESDGLRLLLVALAGVILFHGGLLPFTHGNTYDAFIHMFFADSYHRSWFDHWEPRWYTGFATTAYPPGSHMTIAALMYVMPLRAAFVVVQILALLLLTTGVYRFANLWVPARAAGYASIALVLSSSIAETVHLFGQLPTIFSLGIFLNGLPYVYRWIVSGGLANLFCAVIFAAATTAAHHVTTIFGGVLFILPLGLQALRASVEIRAAPTKDEAVKALIAPLLRGLVLAVLMLIAIVVTIFPYWVWSINDPITQVPIPHGSRDSFVERPDLGFIFFLLPWGAAILIVPYVVLKTVTTRLWPLGLSVLLCLLLGTGGTTPVPRMILRGAFDILTLDRFTFWATILILPFTGLLLSSLLHGRAGEALRAAFGRGAHRALIGGYFLATVSIAVFAAVLPTIQPTQPRFIDPAPIVQFLSEDEHDRWRYLTLGFGDQFAYLAAQTTAQSVDGNYHSARRLPDLTRFSVERLENSKYLGVPGLGSLRQFLVNADTYHLKYVFSNDDFYDPLLHFTGWTRLNRLSNGVTVWEKPDVTPLPSITPRRNISPLHSTIWGVFPPFVLGLAGLMYLAVILKRNFGRAPSCYRPVFENNNRPIFVTRIRVAVVSMLCALALCVGYFLWLGLQHLSAFKPAPVVIAEYLDDLDFRRFQEAHEKFDPRTRPDFEAAIFQWKWQGGLLASYGKLSDVRPTLVAEGDAVAHWSVELDWLTALNIKTETRRITTVLREGRWYIAPMVMRPVQTPARLVRGNEVTWNVVGRRQPRIETDLHRDRLDRPNIFLHGTRLVQHRDRYSIVGALTNVDADPAMTSLFGDLMAEETRLARDAAGQVTEQRLLPSETSGFRIDFEGVLSLTDQVETYDPTQYIPPELDVEPSAAKLEARALVVGSDLYRAVALNGVSIVSDGGKPVITGTAVNNGTETATIIRIIALLYDDAGQPIWSDAGYVETNIYPGQSAGFSMMLPARDAITVVTEIGDDNKAVNGSTQQKGEAVPTAKIGTIPLPNVPGYSAVRLHVSTMTYDPLF